MNQLSRRKFLKWCGMSAAGTVLAISGCGPKATVEAVTDAPLPSSTPVPLPATATATAAAPLEAAVTATDAPVGRYFRPEIIQFHPKVKSRVVQLHDANAWKGEVLDPKVLRAMVDKTLTGLTGLKDAKESWLALFKPTEKIVIKVNAFRNSLIWTHVELVTAVTDSMTAAGIPAENITLYDYYSDELKTAGFKLNKDGPGVRCVGTDANYAENSKAGQFNIQLSKILTECDALINMPVLKSHMMAGLTFALKNHFGSVSYPEMMHAMPLTIPALSSIPEIKDATRLVIGDMLAANTQWKNSFPYWEMDAKGDSILMSYDPLAADTVALEVLKKMAKENGNPTDAIQGMAGPWIKTCAEAGIGAGSQENIEMVEM